jgi:MFS family permease
MGSESTAIPNELPSVPLSRSAQTRNLILFATCTGLQYLAAPVLYVGITQASLCDRLGASAKVANLPATFFFALTVMPAVAAWLFPKVSQLKRNLSICYAANAVVMGLIAFALASSMSDDVKVLLIILQGAVCGATIPTAIALLWEVIGRGAEESRRGVALGLAFGAGPALAVVGSIGQVALLGGEIFNWEFAGLAYPNGFIYLFGLGAPVVGLAAVLSCFFVVPKPKVELHREPFSQVAGLIAGLGIAMAALTLFLFGSDLFLAGNEKLLQATGYGMLIIAGVLVAFHFRDVLSNRVLMLATIVTILVYTGNTIPSNMNLYTSEVLNDLPEKYAGLQNTLRFAFKMVAGALLGWLLTRTNPKAGILATASIFVVAQLWAIGVPGKLYLVAFGIYGAGELVGVYAPNYMLSASRPALMRRTMALATMLMAPAAPAGYLFGAIVDGMKQEHGAAAGFRTSFAVCAAIMTAGILLAAFCLPKRPRPET